MTTTVFETDRVALDNGTSVEGGANGASVSFSKLYNNPVVVSHMATNSGGQPVDSRVANLTGSGCTIYSHEPDQQGHNLNTHTYFVAESGVHEVSEGHRIEAGTHQTKTNVWDDSWNGDFVSFQNDWGTAPVVVATVNTANNGLFATPAISSVSQNGFRLALISPDDQNTHIESIGWIAFPDKGAMTFDGVPVEAARTTNYQATFSANFSSPDYVADSNGHTGTSSWVRGGGTWSATDVNWYFESGSGSGPFGYVAVDTDSTVSGYDALSYQYGTLDYKSDVSARFPNLMGYWSLDERHRNGDKVGDVSGNGLTGELKGSWSWKELQYGANALDLDGSGRVALDAYFDSETALPELTVTAWVKIRGAEWAWLDFDRSEYFNFSANSSGRIQFATNSSLAGNIYDHTVPTDIDDGKWHFVCGVYDGKDSHVYVDGSLVSTVSDVHDGEPLGSTRKRYGFIGIGSEAWVFDGNTNGGPGSYDGLVNEVTMFSTALNNSQIANLYNHTGPLYKDSNSGAGYDTLDANGNPTDTGGTYADTVKLRGTAHTPGGSEKAQMSVGVADPSVSTDAVGSSSASTFSVGANGAASVTVTADVAAASGASLSVDPNTGSTDATVTDGVLVSPKRAGVTVESVSVGESQTISSSTSADSLTETQSGSVTVSSVETKNHETTGATGGGVVGANTTTATSGPQAATSASGISSTTVTTQNAKVSASADAGGLTETLSVTVNISSGSTSVAGRGVQPVATSASEAEVGSSVNGHAEVVTSSGQSTDSKASVSVGANRASVGVSLNRSLVELTTAGSPVLVETDQPVPDVTKEIINTRSVGLAELSPKSAIGSTSATSNSVVTSSTSAFGVDPATASTAVKVTDGVLVSPIRGSPHTTTNTNTNVETTSVSFSVGGTDKAAATANTLPVGLDITVRGKGGTAGANSGGLTAVTATTVTSSGVGLTVGAVVRADTATKTATAETGSSSTSVAVAEAAESGARADSSTTARVYVSPTAATALTATSDASADATGSINPVGVEAVTPTPTADAEDNEVVNAGTSPAYGVGHTSVTTAKVVGESVSSSFSAGGTTATVSVSANDTLLAIPVVGRGETETTADAEVSRFDSLGKQLLGPNTASVSVAEPTVVEPVPVEELVDSVAAVESDGSVTLGLPTVSVADVEAGMTSVVITTPVSVEATDAFSFSGSLQSGSASDSSAFQYGADTQTNSGGETTSDYESDTSY